MSYLENGKIIGFERTKGCTCEHCGTGIKDVVTVKFPDGSTMRIGTTCAEKVGAADPLQVMEMEAVRYRSGWHVISNGQPTKFRPVGWVVETAVCRNGGPNDGKEFEIKKAACFLRSMPGDKKEIWKMPNFNCQKRTAKCFRLKLKKNEQYVINPEHSFNRKEA